MNNTFDRGSIDISIIKSIFSGNHDYGVKTTTSQISHAKTKSIASIQSILEKYSDEISNQVTLYIENNSHKNILLDTKTLLDSLSVSNIDADKILLHLDYFLDLQNISVSIDNTIDRYIYAVNCLMEYIDIGADIVGIVDKPGNYLEISENITQILGWTREEFVGKHWSDFVLAEDLPDAEMQEYIESPIHDRKRIVTSKVKHKDGSFRYLRWQFKTFEDPDIAFITAQDVTSHMEFTKQQEYLARLTDLDKMRRDFFSMISHELRTPLSVIRSTHTLIEKSITIPHYNRLKKNTDRLLRLINNLIDFTEIDAGNYTLNCTSCDIVYLVDSIIELININILTTSIFIKFKSNVETFSLICDENKIQKIVLNILSNAIKHSKANSEVIVDLTVKDNNVEIEICNFGDPIPPQDLDKLFQPFFQIGQVLTRHAEGSGIGLALSYSLAKLHGGDITVSSDIKHTCFTIKLPQGKSTQTAHMYSSDIKERVLLELSDIYFG